MGDTSGDETQDMFRAQFEQADGCILFRYGRRSPPVVVTVQEMEESITNYRRRARLVTNAGVIVMIAAILGLQFAGDFLDRDGAVWLLVLGCTIPYSIAFKRAWKSSTSQFKRRTPVGVERSRGEVRKMMLSDWGWTRTAILPVLGLALVACWVANWPPATIEAWLWFGFGVIFLAIGLFNAAVKWRIEHA